MYRGEKVIPRSISGQPWRGSSGSTQVSSAIKAHRNALLWRMD